MIKPVIVAVGYNRPDTMKRLLTSIEAADYPVADVTLIVSIDECDKSDVVEKVALDANWTHGEKLIRRFDKRQGLRSHILQCGDYALKYGAVIILEDDLVVSPSFYHYMYSAVNHYNDPVLAGFALYSHGWNGYSGLEFKPVVNEYDAYLGQFSITWGQCWTSEQWRGFRSWYEVNQVLPDVNVNMPADILRWSNQSWGKYFASYVVEKNLYYLIPYVSMSTNFSEVGQHNTHRDSAHQVPILAGIKRNYFFPPITDAIKYDMFFERDFSGTTIHGIPGTNICTNLNLHKLSSLGKEYLLTTQQMNLEKICSFGMEARPIDTNITMGIPGHDIFLYRCGNIKLESHRMSAPRRNYELYGYWWKSLFAEAFSRFYHALLRKLKISK